MVSVIASAIATYFVTDWIDKKIRYDIYTGLIGSSIFLPIVIITFEQPYLVSTFTGICAGIISHSFINSLKSSRVYRNRFNGTVYILSKEERGKVYELKPLSTDTPYGIDGLAIPSFRKDAVFKIPNGIKIAITKEGSVKVLGPIARLVTKLRGGGWVSISEVWRKGWLNDNHWSELFEVLTKS